jgi:hypothetical protein
MAPDSHIRPRKIRIPRAEKRGLPRRCRGFRRSFRLPPLAQMGLLHLPALKHFLECQRRILAIETLARLMAGGVSFNQSARAVGLPVSTAFAWLKNYRARGPNGLFRAGRGNRHDPALCTIQFVLRT